MLEQKERIFQELYSRNGAHPQEWLYQVADMWLRVINVLETAHPVGFETKHGYPAQRRRKLTGLDNSSYTAHGYPPPEAAERIEEIGAVGGDSLYMYQIPKSAVVFEKSPETRI